MVNETSRSRPTSFFFDQTLIDGNEVISLRDWSSKQLHRKILTSHTLTSLVVLYPSLALVTILVTRSRGLESNIINTMGICLVSLLPILRVPPRPRRVHPHREAIPCPIQVCVVEQTLHLQSNLK